FHILKMVFYVSLLVVIIPAKNSRLCSNGIAKYKLTKELSQTIKFKYFFPTDKPFQTFANGDIVFISGKFIVKNMEPCFSIAYLSIIDSGNPDREFNTTNVPITILYCMYSVTVNREPKSVEEFVHFGVESIEYNSVTGNSNVKMDMIIIYPQQSPRFKYLRNLGSNIKIRSTYFVSGLFKFSKSGKMIIEATDIDSLKTPTVNISRIESSSSTIANTLSIIDIIDDDIDSTTMQPADKQFGLFETLAKSVNTDIEIGPSHNKNKYHTTVESDIESVEKFDNKENDENPTNSTDSKNSQNTEEQEDELQTKKRKSNTGQKTKEKEKRLKKIIIKCLAKYYRFFKYFAYNIANYAFLSYVNILYLVI
ncbi:40047_t:CDS:1, partial [Gigaspora margarita]